MPISGTDVSSPPRSGCPRTAHAPPGRELGFQLRSSSTAEIAQARVSSDQLGLVKTSKIRQPRKLGNRQREKANRRSLCDCAQDLVASARTSACGLTPANLRSAFMYQSLQLAVPLALEKEQKERTLRNRIRADPLTREKERTLPSVRHLAAMCEEGNTTR